MKIIFKRKFNSYLELYLLIFNPFLMKRITILLFSIILLPFSLIAQSASWPVKAVPKSGKAIPVNVYLEDGTALPVFAIYEAGNDHFMDVKAVHNGEEISIKLIATNDVLVPVKGITMSGDILKVKADDLNGNILDVKGVSRDGNTMNIAAVNPEGKDFPLMAISPAGIEREVKGVKFMGENVEMEFGDIQIIGHVKALPTIEVGSIDRKWAINALTDNGDSMSLFAINKKGREFPIKAEMAGKHPYLMNVKAESSIDINVKLIKNDDGVVLAGIDEYGRMYDVKAKSRNGESFIVVGGEREGNVIPIFVVGANGKKFPVKAISSMGHEFDVKGVKVKDDDVEGIISGLNVWIRYYSHVKALAPPHANQKEN